MGRAVLRKLSRSVAALTSKMLLPLLTELVGGSGNVLYNELVGQGAQCTFVSLLGKWPHLLHKCLLKHSRKSDVIISMSPKPIYPHGP